MANIIKPKRTPTASKVPAISELADGEIAVNYTDKVIYQRIGANVIAIANMGLLPGLAPQTFLGNNSVNPQIAAEVTAAQARSMLSINNVDNTTDLNKPVSNAMGTALALKANLASPTFTGIPAGPTAANGTNTTQLATTAHVLAGLNLKADVKHKYHEFGVGEYYYDNYEQGRYFRLFTQAASSDIVRWAPISDVEYWDGFAWVAWVGGDVILRNMLDGREETSTAIDHAHRKFRFNVTKTTGYPTKTILAVQTTWCGLTYPGMTVTVENQVASVWTVKETCVMTSANTGNDFGLHVRVLGNIHDGQLLSRITFDITDWVDNGSYTTLPIRRFMMLSNYQAGDLIPVSWNYLKVVDFKAVPTVLGSAVHTAATFNPALKANLASPTFTGTVGGITKAMVGLGSVDNTTDAAKPVSTATQTALNLKVDTASVGTSLGLGTTTEAQAISVYPQGLSYNFTSDTAKTALTLRHATDNRVLQLLAHGYGGTQIPALQFRTSHTSGGGGGWTGLQTLVSAENPVITGMIKMPSHEFPRTTGFTSSAVGGSIGLVSAIPGGSSVVSVLETWNAADTGNAGRMNIGVNGPAAYIDMDKFGTGTLPSFEFRMSGTKTAEIYTSGSWIFWNPVSVNANMARTSYGTFSFMTGNAFGRIQNAYYGVHDTFTISSNYNRTGAAAGTIDNGALGTAEVAVMGYNGVSGQVILRAGAPNTAPTDRLSVTNTGIGFNGTAPIAKPTITGSKGGNAALASLLTALANMGLINDSTT